MKWIRVLSDTFNDTHYMDCGTFGLIRNVVTVQNGQGGYSISTDVTKLSMEENQDVRKSLNVK